MASDFIGGGLPSTAAHTDPTVLPTNESPAAIRALEPPASNPGSDDPSGGIAKDAGGLSCTAHLGSPVTQEHEKTTVVGSVYDSVFGKTERSAAEHESTPNTAAVTSSTSEQQASGTGAAGLLGGIAGSVAAGTAAVAAAVGLNQTAETPQEQGEKTAASVEKSTAETQAVAGEKAAEASDSAKATANEASTAIAGKSEPTEPQDPTKMAEKEDSSKAMEQEKSPKPVETEETKEKAKDEDGNVDEEKAKKVEDHKAAVRTNEDAIPTAGGEKLGQAHEVWETAWCRKIQC